MKSLLKWKEFGDFNSPSIKTGFSDKPHPNKQQIIEYLRNGKITLTSAGVGVDVVTNEEVDKSLYLMTDGEYSWSNMIIYYVEKYNLILPKEFIKKILS